MVRAGLRRCVGAKPNVRRQCLGCGADLRVQYKVWRTSPRSGAVDPFFGLPLWLQAPCCGEVLWAWNESHLTVLENYIAATLRERAPNRNASLASRLPTWIKRAKHRKELLECIRHLRRTLVESELAFAAV